MKLSLYLSKPLILAISLIAIAQAPFIHAAGNLLEKIDKQSTAEAKPNISLFRLILAEAGAEGLCTVTKTMKESDLTTLQRIALSSLPFVIFAPSNKAMIEAGLTKEKIKQISAEDAAKMNKLKEQVNTGITALKAKLEEAKKANTANKITYFENKIKDAQKKLAKLGAVKSAYWWKFLKFYVAMKIPPEEQAKDKLKSPVERFEGDPLQITGEQIKGKTKTATFANPSDNPNGIPATNGMIHVISSVLD